MIRGMFLLLFALTIDGLQAGLSIGLLALGSTAGTVGGAAAGAACPTGTQFVCSVVGAVAGTALNPALATIGVPLAIGLGFVVNVVISMILGGAFIVLLAMNGMLFPKFLLGGLGELIPGLDNLPFWTLLAIQSWREAAAREGKEGTVATAASFIVTPTRGIMAAKRASMNMAVRAGVFTPTQQTRAPLPQTGTELQELAAQRFALQDVRPRRI